MLSLLSSTIPPTPRSTLFPYTTLFRSESCEKHQIANDTIEERCNSVEHVDSFSFGWPEGEGINMFNRITAFFYGVVCYLVFFATFRSEERRVGKECRSRCWRYC